MTQTAAGVAASPAKGVAGTSAAFLSTLRELGLIGAPKTAAAVEDAKFLEAVKVLAETQGKAAEPFLFPILGHLLDKQVLPVKQEATRVACLAAANAIVTHSSPASVRPALLPILLAHTKTAKKWQTRVAALNLIAQLPAQAPDQISLALSILVPALSESITDARADVAAASEKAMLACCSACGNGDLDAVIPVIVHCMAKPTSIPECIHQLAATTFVKCVEMPTIAVLAPLLERGLQDRTISVKRMTAVIIENMTKLVMKREHAAPLLPRLLPGLARLRDEVADPEVRMVANRTFVVLMTAAGTDEATAMATYMPAKGKPVAKAAATEAPTGPTQESETETILALLKAKLSASADFAAFAAGAAADKSTASAGAGTAAESGAHPSEIVACFITSLKHVAANAATLSLSELYEESVWADAVVPFLAPYLASPLPAETLAKELRSEVIEKNGGIKEESFVTDVDDGTPDLCKAVFSLAYGSKTLLNSATLHLKVGKKYGLIGPERCGKSTLLRAISNGQLEGFPSKDEVRTVYVDSTIKVEDADFTVKDFVMHDPDVVSGGADEATAIETLKALGFTDVMLAGVVGRLSGGWRCKLALARAQLSRSDIYLLDEPTNHLDVKNVKWLTDYINSLTSTTCIIVAHDSKFLDNTSSHIVHFDGFKLRTYRGNLSAFVKIKPEAMSYYELSASNLAFHFPPPGFLEGVKTKDRAIIKMADVSITYPGREAPVVTGVTLSCSLSSRVVVLGANGAGKSTVIKTIVGEMLPTSGMVWRHPNVRIAYVAQDAFHHLQSFQKHTPMEYVQWRYAAGEDREQLEKATTKVTADEEKLMAASISINGVKMLISRVVNRRKDGKSYEYEVEWVGHGPDKNEWMPRDWLNERGWGKAVDAIDAREAAAAGLLARPLTAANICAHFNAVGLDDEQVLHSRINTLSGGQLIKVVIGAAMWMNPHILIMDEPTNFLDRDSLGALAAAIKEFDGGVLLITHHHDFTKELCGETWNVMDGKLHTIGQSWDTATVKTTVDADETVDAAGNVIKVAKKLTGKLLKAHKKEKAARRKRGESVSDDSDEAV
jgi:elongation factor 3